MLLQIALLRLFFENHNNLKDLCSKQKPLEERLFKYGIF
jgi:hypothetical protein